MLSVCILLQLAVVGYAQQPFDWFGFSGDDWETSDKINNPFYQTYRQLAAQLDEHGYVSHMGKINRGQYTNPELNMPRDRAFGYGHDFNKGDLNSGVFKYQPKGQKVRATQAHVAWGMATSIGQVIVVPPGMQVQADGSVLVQLDPDTQTDPCTPNPCNQFGLSECVAVNSHTAKCTHAGEYTFTLNYNGASGVWTRYTLVVVPVKLDGVTFCTNDQGGDYVDYNSEDECGAEPGDTDYVDDAGFDLGDTTASTSIDLATDVVADEPSFKQYTYQVFLNFDPDFPLGTNSNQNPDTASASLNIFFNGKLVQVIDVPQGGTNPDRKSAYFFGCFVSLNGGGYYMNTLKNGFYNTALMGATKLNVAIGDDIVHGGLVLGNPRLCNAINSA